MNTISNSAKRVLTAIAIRPLTSLAVLLLTALVVLTSCQPKNEPVTPVVPEDTVTSSSPLVGEEGDFELYRPELHYTPSRNWMNDPNGLCYKDGVWHLYYQYNPNGADCDFGAMSWGHAESEDLMNWTEREPVLYPDEMGAMFSGCSVVDTENKAGFGEGAILAYYTASAEKQKICLAISTDNGATYRKYEHNPIVPSTGLANFRDPKIVWDDEHDQYVMVVAKGWDQGLEFWRSTNLKDWSFVPYIFHAQPHRCNLGQYECPDLVRLPLSHLWGEGTEGREAWVLILSTMPGGYITGSGTMYFIGDLTPEGYFLVDESLNGESSNVRWLDYGADCYAGVTWNNAPEGRAVMIGWMNNWDYAPACPTFPWKSAMTLPREYSLRDIDGKLVLCSEPVRELESVAGEWQPITENQFTLPNPGGKGAREGRIGAYELETTISLAEDATVTLSNAYGEQYEVRIDSRCRKILCDRSRSGVTNFTPLFAAPSMSAPIEGQAATVVLRLIVDQSSVELFADGGATCVTNTVYPRAIYNRVNMCGSVISAKYRQLK